MKSADQCVLFGPRKVEGSGFLVFGLAANGEAAGLPLIAITTLDTSRIGDQRRTNGNRTSFVVRAGVVGTKRSVHLRAKRRDEGKIASLVGWKQKTCEF